VSANSSLKALLQQRDTQLAAQAECMAAQAHCIEQKGHDLACSESMLDVSGGGGDGGGADALGVKCIGR
jgi:hypothetical protein